jgi:glucose-6-phosphate-specific signal transduction histidine kinase
LITSRLRDLKNLIGPYPYNPYLIFLFFFALFFSRFIPLISYLPAGQERWRAGGVIILASAIPSAIFAGGALLLKNFRLWSSQSTFIYILEVAFFQYLNLNLLPLVNNVIKNQLGHGYETLVGLSFPVYLASLVLVLMALALMHQADRKINDRLSTVTKLVNKLENERANLMISDENLRKQTSQFLHDRVQSDLMIVGIKLKSISGLSSPEVNEVIEGAILHLEKTRAADLKNLIQVLTPNLDAVTFSSAVDALLEEYRKNIEVFVQIDPATEGLNPEAKLGAFRIIEQAILNSLVHGPATRVQIIASVETSGYIKIVISDNGPGVILEEVSPGVGSAIIDSWVGILGGNRKIDTALGHGYRLEIEFPADSLS